MTEGFQADKQPRLAYYALGITYKQEGKITHMFFNKNMYKA